jgi:hypothetical protein
MRFSAPSRPLALAASLLLAAGFAGAWPSEVEQSLELAGENRGELERVLLYYEELDDARKLQAAEFLIANMQGHGYAVSVLRDEEGNDIPYDALDYANFKEALAALEAIEKEHGSVDFKRRRFDPDLEVMTADFLIENIDLAFQAWQEKPWSRELTFEAFCEYVLPYRGSNEPLDHWRAACLERYADLPTELENVEDAQAAAKRLQSDVHGWVRFREIFYLHPTDQSFSEMDERGAGRCEDISNMIGYALRANAIACASDYTPYWANRDNNHAWEVILDENGEGRAGLSNVAAKIYRKTFALQRDNLAFRLAEGEKAPRWLMGKSYKDVTSQYLETTDVTIQLGEPVPDGARFAYLCVFNGGRWCGIHWGEIDGERVTFDDMGRRIAYLACYFVEGELEPAAPPFILEEDGRIRQLSGSEATLDLDVTMTKPDTMHMDTLETIPSLVVGPGKSYELFVWAGGWQSLGSKTAEEEAVRFEDVPADSLYWLVGEGSREEDRIFTIDEGRQKMW